MRISFTKILLILLIAIAAALLVNYLQPEGLPLFNKEKPYHADESLNSQPPLPEEVMENKPESLKTDLNKMAVEKNRVQIDEDVLPQYQYKTDSDLAKNDENNFSTTNSDKKDNDLNLSSLTRDVFNQPRLISLAQAYDLYRDKTLFVDARDPDEYEDGHIAGAVNLPLFMLDEYSNQMASMDKSEPFVVYCEGLDCDMSIRLGNELFSKGFKKVFVFFGGWEEWKEADYPVVTSSTDIQLN
jgi:rhodanese-related sulfurtransferase